MMQQLKRVKLQKIESNYMVLMVFTQYSPEGGVCLHRGHLSPAITLAPINLYMTLDFTSLTET